MGGRQSHSLPQAANGRFATLISEVQLAGFGPEADTYRRGPFGGNSIGIMRIVRCGISHTEPHTGS